MTLPALLRKAAGDAGFDLIFDSDGEWQRVGVSGTSSAVWILPSGVGAQFAVADEVILREFGETTWTDVPLPSGAAGAVRCRTAEDLHRALSRVRVLFAQLPPAPQERFAQRLAAVDSTETEALVKQRVGQGLFREMLMEYWGGRCAVTGLDVPELLRASHAKPWKESDDRERLDVYNGLLLAVHLDALFDKGLITFEADGALRRSPQLTTDALDLLVQDSGSMMVERLTDMHQPYLAYHRSYVFRSSQGAPEAVGHYAVLIVGRIPTAVIRSSYKERQHFVSAIRHCLVASASTLRGIRSALPEALDPLLARDSVAFDEERAAVQALLHRRGDQSSNADLGYPVVIEADIPVAVFNRPSSQRAAFLNGIRTVLLEAGVEVDDICSASGLTPDPLVMPDHGAY